MMILFLTTLASLFLVEDGALATKALNSLAKYREQLVVMGCDFTRQTALTANQNSLFDRASISFRDQQEGFLMTWKEVDSQELFCVEGLNSKYYFSLLRKPEDDGIKIERVVTENENENFRTLINRDPISYYATSGFLNVPGIGDLRSLNSLGDSVKILSESEAPNRINVAFEIITEKIPPSHQETLYKLLKEGSVEFARIEGFWLPIRLTADYRNIQFNEQQLQDLFGDSNTKEENKGNVVPALDGFLTVKWQYEKRRSDFPMVSRVVFESSKSRPSFTKPCEIIVDKWVYERALNQSSFTLTAFGIREPDGVLWGWKLYWWIIVLGIGLLFVALGKLVLRNNRQAPST